jgi:hypothetical protein
MCVRVWNKNLGKRRIKIRRKNLGVWKKRSFWCEREKKRPVEFELIKIIIKTNNSNDKSTTQDKTLKIEDEYCL